MTATENLAETLQHLAAARASEARRQERRPLAEMALRLAAMESLWVSMRAQATK